MTGETTEKTWLPNLVGGVSIWKLAPDLNEAKFFDGALLVPRTEGTESLPSKVSWDVSELVPLTQARASAEHHDGAAAAVRDFVQRLEVVARELGDPASGYHKFKAAFTVPGLDGEGAENYFYDPSTRKLRVINWGASPRDLSGRGELVFGYERFGHVVAAAPALAAPALAAPLAAAAPAEVPVAAAAAVAVDPPAKDQVKAPDEPDKPEKKVDEKPALPGRPWWHWLLLALLVLALLALFLFFLRWCDAQKSSADRADSPMAVDALSPVDAMVDAPADRAATAADGAGANGADDGGSSARGDAEGGAGADAHVTDLDAGADARAMKLRDGATVRVVPGPKGRLVIVGGGGGGGGGSGSSGTFGGDELPHRTHFEPTAQAWKVVAGLDALDPSSPLEGTGDTFEVVLKPGASFDRVRVAWKDASGKWHQ